MRVGSWQRFCLVVCSFLHFFRDFELRLVTLRNTNPWTNHKKRSYRKGERSTFVNVAMRRKYKTKLPRRVHKVSKSRDNAHSLTPLRLHTSVPTPQPEGQEYARTFLRVLWPSELKSEAGTPQKQGCRATFASDLKRVGAVAVKNRLTMGFSSIVASLSRV